LWLKQHEPQQHDFSPCRDTNALDSKSEMAFYLNQREGVNIILKLFHHEWTPIDTMK